MKKTIIGIFLICALFWFLVGTCTAVKANSIPGFLELDVNYQDWKGLSQYGYANTEIDFVYGVQHDYFQPYIRAGWLTYFEKGYKGYNAPFRDIYSFGGGIRIMKVFYVEYKHLCSHYVRTIGSKADKLYRSLPGSAFDTIKVGLKFNID